MKALSEYLQTDPEFAQELIASFSDNLIEFRESLLKAIKLHDSKIFLDAHHKMKTTLSYTQNDRLQQLADHIKLIVQQKGITCIEIKTKNAFCRLCNNSVIELKDQLNEYLNIPV
jgi:hypothetical protein